MNHDAAHCLSYDNRYCPKKCYRAEITEDLGHRPDLVGIPVDWADFRRTEECPKWPKQKHDYFPLHQSALEIPRRTINDD